MTIHKLKNFWPQILIFLSIVFFLREILFFGKMFVSPGWGLGDYTLGAVPISHYWSEAFKEGRFPLWAPEFFSGYPLAVDGEPGLFYPLNIFLFWLFPHPTALSLYVFFAFLILGFSTFYFLKTLNLSKEAALVGTLSFTFAAGVVAKIVHLPVIGTIAFLPLSLFLTEQFFNKRNPLLLFLIGLILSFQILNFNPPVTLICFTGFTFYFLFKIWGGLTQSRKLLVDLGALLFVFILAVFLSAVQLLPSLKLFLLSARTAGAEDIQAERFTFHFEELAYFLRPDPFGNPALGNFNPPYPEYFSFIWENNAYIGLLGLLFGLFALFTLLRRPKKTVVFFTLIFLLSLFLALGQYTLLSPLFKLQPFSLFRVPGRFLILSMFSLAVLSAFGFEKLTDKILNKRSILGFFSAIIILVDLFSFDLFYNPTYDAQKWLAPTQSTEFLKSDPSFFRIFSFGEIDAFFALQKPGFGWQKDLKPYYNLREGLPPLSSLLYGFTEAEGERLGLVPQRFTKWQEEFLPNIRISTQLWKMELNSQALKMLRLKNVKYVITPFKTDGSDFLLRKEVTFDTGQPSFYIYELKNPLPHTFIVHKAEVIPDGEQVLNKFLEEDFDPQKEVLLEEPFTQFAQLDKLDQLDQSVTITTYLPEKVVIAAQTESPGFLVLTDTYFPRWEAKVDGQPAKIYQADYLFRAVRVEPGQHQVEFEYKPKEIYLGAKISLGTLAFVIIFSLYWLIRRRFAKS